MTDRYAVPSPGPRPDRDPEVAPRGAAGSAPADEMARLRAENGELQRRLVEAQAESDERQAQVLRLRADHLNYRRRTEQEREEERRRASGLLVIKLLPVLDDLERALDTAGRDLEGLHWVQGIRQIARKLQQALASEGLTRVDPLGQPFDPTQHEAVLREPTEDEHVGRVLSVVQPGYRFGDRLLRPAMVKVGVARERERERGDRAGT